MRDNCIFLEISIGREGKPTSPRCTAGINFCGVGEKQEFCRLCPLAGREPTPVCGYAFVYTFLVVKDRRRTIEVRVECDVTQREMDGVGPCLHCPAYAKDGPVLWPKDTPLPVGPTFQPEGSPLPTTKGGISSVTCAKVRD